MENQVVKMKSPCLTGPQWMTLVPMQVRISLAAANSSSVAPTMKESSPDLAFMTPPETGAS